MSDQLKPAEAYRLLLEAYKLAAQISGRAGLMHPDAAFAAGEAMGCLSRAVALAERDANDCANAERREPQ